MSAPPIPSPLSQRSLPGRAGLNGPPQPLPGGSEEVALTAAEMPSRQNSNPAQMSAGWTSGGSLPERKKPAFGLVGLVLAAATVGILVFLAVKILVLDQQ